MLLANAPVWIVLLLQQILWTSLVWLSWQLIRKFISFSAAQIYFTNVVLQLSAAMGLIIAVFSAHQAMAGNFQIIPQTLILSNTLRNTLYWLKVCYYSII